MITAYPSLRYLLAEHYDRYQLPMREFGSRQPGKPCGKAYISPRKQCSKDKSKEAAQRLKGTDEGKRYADKVRRAKGLKPNRENLTNKVDRQIAQVRKIKDPLKRYQAAQDLYFEQKRYRDRWSRDAFAGMRRKVKRLVDESRRAAGAKDKATELQSKPMQLSQVGGATLARTGLKSGPKFVSIDSADTLRVIALAVKLRMDRKGQGKPCGKGFISSKKKCSKDKLAQLTADLKAGDNKAKERVKRGAELGKERQSLKKAVKASKGKKPYVKETADERRKRIESGNVGGAVNSINSVKSQEERITTARADLTPKPDHSKIPEGLRQYLSDHQKDGVALAISAMDSQGGFLNADGTGVGKTRQQLAVAANYAMQGKKVLIVTKAEVIKPDWKKGTLSGSFDKDGEIMGYKPKLTKGENPLEKGSVSITTYDNLGKVKGLVDKDTVLILDEAHALKNWESARTKHGTEMIKNAGAVMYATATPADKPLQLGYLSRAGIFNGNSPKAIYEWMGLEQTEVHVGGGQYVKKWEMRDRPENVYHKMTGMFDEMTERGLMIKREISLEGVPVGFKKIKLSDKAKQEQAEIMSAFLEQKMGVMTGFSGSTDKLWNRLLEQEESGKNFGLSGLEKAQVLMHQRRQLEPYKVDAAVSEAKQAIQNGRQVVLFASRVNQSDVNTKNIKGENIKVAGSEGTTKLLRDALKKAGISESDIAEIHGGQTKTKSNKAMADFQNGKAKVVIATVESGGTGINLDDTTGNAPRTLIMMTAPFSAVDNVQAAGRVWRMSTKSTPEIKYLFADTPVDRWNRDLITGKMAALNASIQGETAKLVGKQVKDLGTAPRPPRPPKTLPGKLKGSEKQVNWASSIRDEAFTSVDQTIARLKETNPIKAAQYQVARDKAFDELNSARDWIDNRSNSQKLASQAMSKYLPSDTKLRLFKPQGDGALTGSPKQISWAEKIRSEGRTSIDKELSKLQSSDPEQYALMSKYKDQALMNLVNSSTWIDNRMSPASLIKKEIRELIAEDKELAERSDSVYQCIAHAVKHRQDSEGTLISSLDRNKNGEVRYQGKWWKIDEPRQAPAGSPKKRQVLAKKGDRVKLVSYGARGYKHNYSKEGKANYLSRSAGIRGKDGNLTKDDPWSANHWARKDLWPKGKPDGKAKYDSLTMRDHLAMYRADRACGKGWRGTIGNCKRVEPKEGRTEAVKEAGKHIAENVAAWTTGKVVGGALTSVAASHGIPAPIAAHVAESGVQALAATLIHARDPKHRNPRDLAVKFISEAAGAMAGKLAHWEIDDAIMGGDETVKTIAAMVAGKGTGAATVASVTSGFKRQQRVLGGIVNRWNRRTDADSRNTAGLSKAELEALFDLALVGVILGTRKN